MPEEKVPEETSEARVALARILRPQGRKGEVLSELLTDHPEEFRAGRVFRLRGGPAPMPPTPADATLEDSWQPTGKNAGRIVLKFAGCDSISQAELLAGREVTVAATELPELEADAFYVRDLLGCTLYDGNHAVGEVVDLQFATSADGRVRLQDAAPLLCVLPAGSSEDPLLVPFVKAYLREVNIADRRIAMDLPEGLLASSDEPDDAPGKVPGEAPQQP